MSEEQYEELKKENAELLADKLHLIGAAMDGGDKYHYAAHDIGYRDMERKVKALEADYVISNRELLILQQRIAELESVHRWIPVSERLPEESGWYRVGAINVYYEGYTDEVYFDADKNKLSWQSSVRDKIYCWLDGVPELPQPPEVQE